MQKAHLKKKEKKEKENQKKKKGSEQSGNLSVWSVSGKRFHLNMSVAPLAAHDNHSFLQEVEMRFGPKRRTARKKKKKAALKTNTHSKTKQQARKKKTKKHSVNIGISSDWKLLPQLVLRGRQNLERVT